jgi:ParB family chromosome partitioning protein
MDSESLQELADSIRSQGLMQPILVREVAEGYEIIAGERRWRAAQLAGLAEVPVLVREVPDHAVAAMALIENIQREDLNAIDEAHGLQRLIQEFGMTHDAVAQSVGKSRTAVSNLLRLLNLSRPVQDMLVAGLIEMGHARALLPLHAGIQRELAHEIETRGLSVREVERRVARLKDTPATPAKQAVSRDVLRLEEALADTLGMTAHIQTSSKGSGKLTLHFGSADELQGLLQRLGIQM